MAYLSSFLSSPGLIDRKVRALDTFFFFLVPVLSPVLYGGFGKTNVDIETFPNPNYVWICLMCLVISPMFSYYLKSLLIRHFLESKDHVQEKLIF